MLATVMMIGALGLAPGALGHVRRHPTPRRHLTIHTRLVTSPWAIVPRRASAAARATAATYNRALRAAALPRVTDSCDWGNPYSGQGVVEDPFIDFGGIYLPGDPARCGIELMENDAYDIYANTHGLPSGDPRIELTGQAEIAGIFWTLVNQLVLLHENDPSHMTADDKAAYSWLQDKVAKTPLVAAAQDAQNEYKKWAANPCGYSPPNPKLFSFTPLVDSACGPGFGSLLRGPTPPSYEEFIQYGQYDANQAQGEGIQQNAAKYSDLLNQQIDDGIGVGSGFAFGISSKLTLSIRSDLQQRWIYRIFPTRNAKNVLKSKRDARKRVGFKKEQTNQELKDVKNEANLEKEGLKDSKLTDQVEKFSSDASKIGEKIPTELPKFELGLDALDGPIIVVSFAVDALVEEATKVFQELAIPTQLQQNLDDIKKKTLDDLLAGQNADGSAQTSLEYFKAHLVLSSPTIGTPARIRDGGRLGASNVMLSAPFDGSEWEVSDMSGTEVAGGDVLKTSFQPTVQLVTWPLGVDRGLSGLNQTSFGIYKGQVWHQVNGNVNASDEAADGLTGWVPSGELRYFDWEGNPRLAIVDGNQFLDMPSPGSVDLGAQDASDLCALGDAECHKTNVLFAVESASGVNSSNTTFAYDANGNFGVQQLSQASNGTLKPPYKEIRLTMKPDPGAQAVQNINNQWGNSASTYSNPKFGQGGLFAGDTVTLVDPEANAFGYPETYTWKIESRCAGLKPCTADSDPAFHGNPAVTVNGQSVQYTWPAPGTYHIRLTTSDQYGATQVSDQDVTVDGVNPTVTFGSSTGFAGDGVFGPVKNGSPQTITGCIADPDNAYVNPQVTVDWGDGTTETQSGRGGGSSTLSFNYGTTASCPQLWQFSATHSYNLSPGPGFTQVQKPLQITVSDGAGDSTVRNFAINVDLTSPPQFTSANSTTIPAGVTGSFPVTAGGTPAPAITRVSGNLPPGIVLQTDAHGRTTISGATGAVNAGSYPITIQASNSQGTVTQNFTLNVTDGPTINSPGSQAIAVNQNSTVNITASGSPSPSVLIRGSLPPGMVAVDSTGGGTGSITGTPTATGSYPLTIESDNSAGSTTQAFTLVVGSNPSFTSSSTANFVQNASASTFNITTSGFPAASISCAAPCTLPSGLSFHDNGDGTAQIFGSASASATDQVTLTATNSVGSTQQTLTVTSSAFAGPSINVTGSGVTFDSSKESGTAAMSVGSNANISISASPGGGLTMSEQGSLPQGVTFTDNGNGNATISGTPAAGTGGWYGLIIKAHPGQGIDGFAFLELEVEGPPTMTSSPTAVFTAGQSGSFTVTTTGLPRASISTADAMPDGLHLTDNGDGTATITGTPAADAVGKHTIAVQMENLISFPNSVAAPLTIEVDQVPAITSGANVGFGEGRSGSFTLTTSGSPAPKLQLVSGSLPPGIAFKDNGDGTGTFSGTPTDTTDATYSATVLASSQAGQAAQTLTIAIGPAPAIASQDTADFTAGSSGSFPINSPTTPAPSFIATGLPAGLSLTDHGDGTAAIDGTPQAGTGGAYSVTVTATNAYGSTTKTISLTVAEAPKFVGTQTGLTCASADPTDTSASFLSTGGWTLCASGYPQPLIGFAGTLPPGITFKDNGDGSAQISGKADPGKGGPYPLTLIIINAAGRTTVPLTLTIDQPVDQTARPAATFVSGQSNTYTISAPGYPLPKMFLTPGRGCGDAPDWLNFQDNGDGTATLAGNPPGSAIGKEFDFSLREDQGVGNGAFLCVAITVAPVTLVSKTPPAPTVGSAYDYKFTSTDPTATYSVVPTGSTLASHLLSSPILTAASDVSGAGVLPTGMHLSKAGVLSGTPTTVGTWVFRVVVTTSRGRAVSAPITIHGRSARHQLEIRAFRLYGPAGTGDWFVTARNMSRVTMPLFGWSVGIFPPGQSTPVKLQLPVGWLRPGEDITVAGPSFSLARRTRTVFGSASSRIPGGFELIAPDGRVVDRAGEVGAPRATIARRGVPVPRGRILGTQTAFVRRGTRGHLIDTDNNAHDFSYQSLVVAIAQRIAFTSTPPRHAAVGGRYRVRALGGGSGKQVKLHVSGHACVLLGDGVRFTRAGLCVIKATQLGNLLYAAARPAYQRIRVYAR